MAGSVDPSARLVQPEGVALAIVVVSPIFLFLSILAVAARMYVRVREKVTSIDDYLLLGSLVSTFIFLLRIILSHFGLQTYLSSKIYNQSTLICLPHSVDT